MRNVTGCSLEGEEAKIQLIIVLLFLYLVVLMYVFIANIVNCIHEKRADIRTDKSEIGRKNGRQRIYVKLLDYLPLFSIGIAWVLFTAQLLYMYLSDTSIIPMKCEASFFGCYLLIATINLVDFVIIWTRQKVIYKCQLFVKLDKVGIKIISGCSMAMYVTFEVAQIFVYFNHDSPQCIRKPETCYLTFLLSDVTIFNTIAWTKVVACQLTVAALLVYPLVQYYLHENKSRVQGSLIMVVARSLITTTVCVLIDSVVLYFTNFNSTSTAVSFGIWIPTFVFIKMIAIQASYGNFYERCLPYKISFCKRQYESTGEFNFNSFPYHYENNNAIYYEREKDLPVTSPT